MNRNNSFSFINFTLYNNHFNKVIYITKEHVEKMSIEFSKLFFFASLNSHYLMKQPELKLHAINCSFVQKKDISINTPTNINTSL